MQVFFLIDQKKAYSSNKKKQFFFYRFSNCKFYPFKKTLSETKMLKDYREYRYWWSCFGKSSAKNSKDVVIITDKEDYENLKEELKRNNGSTSLNFREKMASKAFNFTAYYDSLIANWYNEKLGVDFPEKKTFFGERISSLRYGENPHQKSSIYLSSLYEHKINFNKLNGKDLSYNNYNDIFAGLELLFSQSKLSSTVIIKHANPFVV